MTTQHTNTVWRRAGLLPGPGEAGDGWQVFAQVSHGAVPAGVVPEDPYMWVDHRDNWHIINHAYNVNQVRLFGSMWRDWGFALLM